MTKKPLFPHIPKKKEALFPHVPKEKRIERLPQTSTYYTISFQGATTFKVGEIVSEQAFKAENERVTKLGLRPARGWVTSKGELRIWRNGWRPPEEIEEYPPQTLPQTLRISSLFDIWVKEWAKQFDVLPLPVVVTDKFEQGEDGRYDWGNERILVSQSMVDYAEKSGDALKAVKHIIAHEFGHYILLRKVGVTPKDTHEVVVKKLSAHGIDHVASERHANRVAKKLTGLGVFDVMNLMDRFMT